VRKVADYILFVRKIAESAIFAGFAKLQSLQTEYNKKPGVGVK